MQVTPFIFNTLRDCCEKKNRRISSMSMRYVCVSTWTAFETKLSPIHTHTTIEFCTNAEQNWFERSSIVHGIHDIWWLYFQSVGSWVVLYWYEDISVCRTCTNIRLSEFHFIKRVSVSSTSFKPIRDSISFSFLCFTVQRRYFEQCLRIEVMRNWFMDDFLKYIYQTRSAGTSWFVWIFLSSFSTSTPAIFRVKQVCLTLETIDTIFKTHKHLYTTRESHSFGR